jgi:hypothetical protein
LWDRLWLGTEPKSSQWNKSQKTFHKECRLHSIRLLVNTG